LFAAKFFSTPAPVTIDGTDVSLLLRLKPWSILPLDIRFHHGVEQAFMPAAKSAFSFGFSR
jgi:hypothetical protein